MNSYGNIDSRIPVDPLAEFWGDEQHAKSSVASTPADPATMSVPAFTSSGGPLLPLGGNMWRTEELLSQGLSKRRINECLRCGSLVRVRTGVMVRGTFWNGLTDEGRERARLAAYSRRTLPASADGLTFSHTSAARLHRLYLWKVNQLIHVTIPYHAASGSHAADVRAHSGVVRSGQRIEIDGLPVTNLDRTVVDCALMLSYRQALILLDHALRRGCSREWLESECARLAGVRGVAAFRKALAFSNPLSESPGRLSPGMRSPNWDSRSQYSSFGSGPLGALTGSTSRGRILEPLWSSMAGQSTSTTSQLPK